MRLGGYQQMGSTGSNPAPSGYVSVGGYCYGDWDNSADGWFIRPLQKLINGTGITSRVCNYVAFKNITSGNPKTAEQYELTKGMASSGCIQNPVKTGMKSRKIFHLTH